MTHEQASLEQEQKIMRAEIKRVPVGTHVRARNYPGRGIVRELVTEHRSTDGRVIPYRGFVEARVWYPDDFGGIVESFNTRDLSPVK